MSLEINIMLYVNYISNKQTKSKSHCQEDKIIGEQCLADIKMHLQKKKKRQYSKSEIYINKTTY